MKELFTFQNFTLVIIIGLISIATISLISVLVAA